MCLGAASPVVAVPCPWGAERYAAAMSRVVSGGLSARNPFGPQWAKATTEAQTLGQQVENELFGRKKPRELDPDDKDCAALLARLHAYKGKLARLAGDDDSDYTLALAAGTIAMIDKDGKIYVGKRFLLATSSELAIQVGVLAHEIGHRPKRWAEYREERPRNRKELDALCRLEETYADYFAGRALAELGLPPEPLIAFLLAVTDGPHPAYFAPELRASVIGEGHADAARKADTRKKLFPALNKRLSAKLDLGSG